jgi:hypothetical protein
VDENVDDVNGEEVERRAREQQWIEFVRCGVSGVGFAMGVLGIWGDGSWGWGSWEVVVCEDVAFGLFCEHDWWGNTAQLVALLPILFFRFCLQRL